MKTRFWKQHKILSEKEKERARDKKERDKRERWKRETKGGRWEVSREREGGKEREKETREWDGELSYDRLKLEGLEPTLSNNWFKNEGLEPTLLNERLKIRAGTDIVESSSYFPMVNAKLWV